MTPLIEATEDLRACSQIDMEEHEGLFPRHRRKRARSCSVRNPPSSNPSPGISNPGKTKIMKDPGAFKAILHILYIGDHADFFVFIYTSICVYTYICVYVRAYIHTIYTYTYIHIYICARVLGSLIGLGGRS